ncbi:hypothetical protein BD311DRAFT_767993 [Dichomitus squalens]|uniref:Uncharacterized protein n=1 Tax=Dichomitus squalens TaxID=114155 RepID=A0A4Q9MBQ6_9APHY|nr:hypothetical protein BD311DRAFT_767993 [Dichomitus squalens]
MTRHVHMFIIWREQQSQGSSAGRWMRIKERTLYKALGVFISFDLSPPAPMSRRELHVMGVTRTECSACMHVSPSIP